MYSGVKSGRYQTYVLGKISQSVTHIASQTFKRNKPRLTQYMVRLIYDTKLFIKKSDCNFLEKTCENKCT
jgi:hypothetical protein